MKKITVLVLIFIFIFSSLQAFASDAKTADVKTMVVLGDSISTGYGLDGYETGAQNAEISSYANITASRYRLTLGEGYFNYASNGETSKGLLDDLTGGYSEEKLASIASADTVVLTVGGNDILSFLVPRLTAMLGLEDSASSLDIVLALAKIKDSDLDGISKSAKSFCDDHKDELSELYNQYNRNVEDIVKKLKEISPNAKIFAFNIYDPLLDMPDYSTVKMLDEKIVSVVISEMNETLLKVSEKGDLHIVDIASEFLGRKEACTNIEMLDIHPSSHGHAIAADALALKIDSVYKASHGASDAPFDEPKHIWLWFAGALAVVALAAPTIVLVAKKSAK